jgi:hypothetical protein
MYVGRSIGRKKINHCLFVLSGKNANPSSFVDLIHEIRAIKNKSKVQNYITLRIEKDD